MRRRVTALITAVVLSPTPFAFALSAPSAYAASTTSIYGATAWEQADGHQIVVIVDSEQTVERVQATIHHPDGAVTTFDDFTLRVRSGTKWQFVTTSLFTVPAVGEYVIDASAWDSSGARADRASAGTFTKRYATRISVTAAPTAQTLLVYRDDIILSGLVEYQRLSGEWVPLAGASVRIVRDNVDDSRFPTWNIATIEADADGRYSYRVGVSESALYRVGVVSGDLYAASEAATETFNAYWHTEIAGADATPEPAGQGSTVTMRSQVVRPDTSGSRGVVAGVPVVLQFSSDGTNWQQVTTGTTDTEGLSELSVVADRDGYWRTVYAGGASGNASAYTPDMSATSETDYVDVKYATRMSEFNASPEPVYMNNAITVKGRLDRLVGSWKPAGANAGITIYFKPTGATSWTTMASVKTNSTGWFSKAFTASKDGYWMAKYNGSSTYLPIEGPGDFVDVR